VINPGHPAHSRHSNASLSGRDPSPPVTCVTGCFQDRATTGPASCYTGRRRFPFPLSTRPRSLDQARSGTDAARRVCESSNPDNTKVLTVGLPRLVRSVATAKAAGTSRPRYQPQRSHRQHCLALWMESPRPRHYKPPATRPSPAVLSTCTPPANGSAPSQMPSEL